MFDEFEETAVMFTGGRFFSACREMKSLKSCLELWLRQTFLLSALFTRTAIWLHITGAAHLPLVIVSLLCINVSSDSHNNTNNEPVGRRSSAGSVGHLFLRVHKEDV